MLFGTVPCPLTGSDVEPQILILGAFSEVYMVYI